MSAKKDSIRTSVYLEKQLQQKLKKESEQKGQSLTYIINKALKVYLEEKRA
jgi:predicted DNA-binding protein